MTIKLNEDDLNQLIEKTVKEKVNSHVDKYFKENVNHYELERLIRLSIRERINSISDEEFNKIFTGFDKKLFTENLSDKIYNYLFDNCGC